MGRVNIVISIFGVGRKPGSTSTSIPHQDSTYTVDQQIILHVENRSSSTRVEVFSIGTNVEDTDLVIRSWSKQSWESQHVFVCTCMREIMNIDINMELENTNSNDQKTFDSLASGFRADPRLQKTASDLGRSGYFGGESMDECWNPKHDICCDAHGLCWLFMESIPVKNQHGSYPRIAT